MTARTAPDGRLTDHSCRRLFWQVGEKTATEWKQFAASSIRERYGASLTWPQIKVLRAIARCRTAALGGHLDVCNGCGYVPGISYNLPEPALPEVSDRRSREVARQAPTRTAAGELFPSGLQRAASACPADLAEQKDPVHSLVRSSAATLPEVAANPKHLGTEIGFLRILRTWGQTLQAHPHIHCVVPGGGLSSDHDMRVPTVPGVSFFLLSR